MKTLAQFALLVVNLICIQSVSAQISSEQNPEVRIIYGSLLEKEIRGDLPKETVDKLPIPDRRAIEENIEIDKQQWKVYEDRIVTEIQKTLGLKFKQNTLDVYRVSSFDVTFSDPLLISMSYSKKGFVRALTHELLHRLLTDNTKKAPVDEIWEEMFPGETTLTRNHVLVFAVITHLFTDVLYEPGMLARERAVGDPEYARAWQIVDERGYEKIIRDFRAYYE